MNSFERTLNNIIMKITTLFCCVLLFGISTTAYAQNQPNLNELLIRHSQNHMGALSDIFTAEELQLLQNHFNEKVPTQSESNVLVRRGSSTKGNTPIAVVSINPDDFTTQNHGASFLTEFEGAGATLQAINNRAIIVDNGNTMHFRGLNNNLYETQGPIINMPPGESITGIEILTNGDVYGMSTNGMGSSHLLMIDPMTRMATQIGGNNGLVLPISLARDGMDNLLVLDIDNDMVYGADKATGVVSVKGHVGFDANFGQGMAYDENSNKILMTAYNATIGDSQLRELNPITGASINLGTITPGLQDQFGWVGWYDLDLLGVTNTSLEGFIMYPNPAHTELHLSAKYPIDLISVYNLLGQTLYTVTPRTTNSTIDVSAFETGTYLIKTTINGQLESHRFLKQ